MANKSPAKKDTAKKTDADTAPTKRSAKRLALVAAVALAALAGGGYGAWAYLLKPTAPAAEAEHAPDPVKVAAIAPEVAAETSFTHSYALSVLIRPAGLVIGETVGSWTTFPESPSPPAQSPTRSAATGWTAISRRR